MEGVIIGMDEYMNLVLDDAAELSMKKESSKALGTESFFNLCLFYPIACS